MYIHAYYIYAIYNECMIKTHIFYLTARGIVCWVIEVKLNRYENTDEWLRLVKVGLWFQLNWKALWFSELYAQKYMSSQVNFLWMQPSFVCISPKHSLLVNLTVLCLYLWFSCLANTPELRKWIECMFEDPVVKATMFNTEDHKVFFNTYMDGNPNYDHGL